MTLNHSGQTTADKPQRTNHSGQTTADKPQRTNHSGQTTADKPQRTNSNKNAFFLEWCFAWEILICSGGVGSHSGFRHLPAHSESALILVTSLALYLTRPKAKKASTSSMLIVVIWTLVNSFLFDFTLTKIGMSLDIDSKFYTAAMYFGVSALSFKSFREILLKALTYLSAATLIAWTLHITLGVGSFGKPPAPTFEIFMDWGGRMASIYWEPGQYQIILIFVLVLFFDELRQMSFSNLIYYIKKFGILVSSIIVCHSSMGYLSLMTVIGLAFMFNKSAKKNKFLYILLLVIAVGFGLLIFSSEVVQNKIDPRNLSRRSSLYIRMWDNIALWNISLISPLTGVGTSSEYAKYSRMNHNSTASNGWLQAAACYGWPLLIFIILCILRNLKRMKFGFPALMAFIPLFMSYSNEAHLLYPIMFIYMYRFKDYS